MGIDTVVRSFVHVRRASVGEGTQDTVVTAKTKDERCLDCPLPQAKFRIWHGLRILYRTAKTLNLQWNNEETRRLRQVRKYET